MNLETANKNIRDMVVLALISVGVQFLLVLLGFLFQFELFGNKAAELWTDPIVNVMLLVILGLLKSRVTGVLIAAMYLFGQIVLSIDYYHSTGSPGLNIGRLMMLLLFVVVYYRGIVGSFVYQRYRKKKG